MNIGIVVLHKISNLISERVQFIWSFIRIWTIDHKYLCVIRTEISTVSSLIGAYVTCDRQLAATRVGTLFHSKENSRHEEFTLFVCALSLLLFSSRRCPLCSQVFLFCHRRWHLPFIFHLLYVSLTVTGEEWKNNYGWNNSTNEDYCTFYGVACSFSQGFTFLSIRLDNNNLGELS